MADEIRDRTNKSENKISKADFFAIVISVFALIASCLSLLYSISQTRLLSGQVRAYVQVIDVKLVEPITDATYITLKLNVKNLGQTAAIKVRSEMNYQLYAPDAEGDGNIATRVEINSMGPGLERILTLSSNRTNKKDWPTPSLRGGKMVYFFGTLWYTDDTTKEERKEDWCYKLSLKTEDDLKKTDLEPCDILTYKSREKPSDPE